MKFKFKTQYSFQFRKCLYFIHLNVLLKIQKENLKNICILKK